MGIYARLSVEGGDRKNESIETQIEIAREYMRGRGDMVLYGCYTDLGRTGTSFEREGFGRLMADVRLRRVDCVIVKDFSRFGRNYIETGNYIQKIFPFLGVRFVAVTDCFDSLFSGNDELGVNLKNLANEMYARDIALKVRSSKRAKRESGSYVGGIVPYGYSAGWIGGKKCLFAEAGAAEVVKWIFGQYDEGKSLREIAGSLYAQEIHRPTEYRRYGHLRRQPGEALCGWQRTSIKAILTNPVYTGCQTAADTEDGKCAPQRMKELTSGDEAAGRNTHEAIVDREQFARIARSFEARAEKTGRQASHENLRFSENRGFSEKPEKPEQKDIFDGLLFCGCCGKKLGRRGIAKRSGSGSGTKGCNYFCRNSTRIDEFRCGTGVVSSDVLAQMVKAVLRQQAVLNDIVPESLARESAEYAAGQKKQIRRKCDAIEKKRKAAARMGSEQYRKYREGILGREAFLEWKSRDEKEAERARESLEREKDRIAEVDATQKRLGSLFGELTKPDRKVEPGGKMESNESGELASALPSALMSLLFSILIEKIRLYPDRRVEIAFRFAPGCCTDRVEAGDSGGQEA